MAYYYKRRAIRKGGRRPRRRVGRKARPFSRVSSSVRTYVKKAIHKSIENKCWIDYGVNQTIASSGGSTPTNINLLPTLSVGAAHGQRLGNSIRVVKGFVRGHVNVKNYNSISNPQTAPTMVKMWLLSCKQLNTTTLSTTAIGTNFFELTNSSVGLQGNLLDLHLTPNKEYWNVLATKSFELGVTYASASGAMGTTGYYDNSKMTLPFYFSFSKHIKQLRYDDYSTVPINRNLFLAFQAIYADGSNTAGYQIAEYHYTTRVEYEDA